MELAKIDYRYIQEFLLANEEPTHDELNYYDEIAERFANESIDRFSISCEEFF